MHMPQRKHESNAATLSSKSQSNQFLLLAKSILLLANRSWGLHLGCAFEARFDSKTEGTCTNDIGLLCLCAQSELTTLGINTQSSFFRSFAQSKAQSYTVMQPWPERRRLQALFKQRKSSAMPKARSAAGMGPPPTQSTSKSSSKMAVWKA